MDDLIQKFKNFLVRRQQAYQNVFDPESVFVKVVLSDLAKFCRANESTFNPDPRVHAVLEGRREVWLRIQQHVKLSPDEFRKIYGKDLE